MKTQLNGTVLLLFSFIMGIAMKENVKLAVFRNGGNTPAFPRKFATSLLQTIKKLYFCPWKYFQSIESCETDVNHVLWRNIPAKAEQTSIFVWISHSAGYRRVQV